jgi:hypothetical protein
MDRGSRMKVGRVTLLRSAPGRSCDMMCMRTGGGNDDQPNCGIGGFGGGRAAYHYPDRGQQQSHLRWNSLVNRRRKSGCLKCQFYMLSWSRKQSLRLLAPECLRWPSTILAEDYRMRRLLGCGVDRKSEKGESRDEVEGKQLSRGVGRCI